MEFIDCYLQSMVINCSCTTSSCLAGCFQPVPCQHDNMLASHLHHVVNMLQVYSKQGLISTKEDKHSGNTIVTGINRNHTLLADYRPYKTADGAAAGPQLADTAPASGGTAVPIAPLAIEEVYKPTKEVKGEL
eukprot:GHRR01026628.1.p1 GENE.GHRR01026628.1~~GHRR01026628.1.p1  ORF type:complete len:133 (-),score=40.24 GHRR01026628.1:848-1246(-)